ncbi:MAG: hypothetical protein LBH74_00345 [Nitrososphaerota archaeon]|jgi:hypothetical protein|nr:hypothetical protein [Nitrososphaerota archaeon]
MKKKLYLVVTAVSIIILILISGFLLNGQKPVEETKTPQAFVGIAYCGNTVAEGKLLIDKVKGYTNLFALQSGMLYRDLSSVEELGDYAIDAGMYFLPSFGEFVQETLSDWLDTMEVKWGDHLLGVYHGDEPGGKMLDDYVKFSDPITGDSITKTKYGDIVVQKPNGIVINYQLDGAIRLSEPAPAGSSSDINSEKVFYTDGTVEVVKVAPNGFSFQTYQQLQDLRVFKDVEETVQRFYARDSDKMDFLRNKTQTFTSDYALYWFDYLAGYNVMLSQIGWNLSITQQIALLRGAASAQQKDWGVIITWKYQHPPFLDSGTEILSQLKTSYECGAKYLIVFDYYTENSGPYGTMKEEHFEAMKTFWKDVVKNPKVIQGSIKADTLMIFPKDYGWGTRWAEDKIWGIFKADHQTQQLWMLMQTVLEEHGLTTDIIYDDTNYPPATMYQNIYHYQEYNSPVPYK